MKTQVLILISFLFSLSIQSQNSTYPDTPYSRLFMINTEGDNIYTAGSCDIVMVSEDHGSTWDIVDLITYNLKSIEIVPNTNGKKAYFLYGSSINTFDIESKTLENIGDDNLSSMSDNFKKLFVVGNDIYIVDDAGVFKSTVGEYNWEKIIPFDLEDQFIMRTDMSESYIWLGTSIGKVIRVDMADGNQTEIHDFGKRLFNVEMVNDETGYFTYQTGSQIYKLAEGLVFPLDGMPETSSPLALGENILMTVNTNRIYVSTDGGVTSTYFPMPKDGMTSLVNSFVLKSDTTLYLAGEATMVLQTNDLCQTFAHLNPMFRENLESIVFNENAEGYAVGGQGNIVHTMDGGESWSHVDWSDQTFSFFQSVVDAGPQRFLMATNSGILIVENKTVIHKEIGSCSKLLKSAVNEDIYAIRNNTGYYFSKSSDYGDTWEDIYLFGTSPYELFQAPSGKLFTTDSAYKLISSTDLGNTWESMPMTGLEGTVSRFFFLDDENGLVSVGNKLYKTTDGGITTEVIGTNYSMDNLFMFSTDHYLYTFATNNLTNIQETTDGGLTWQNTASFCTPTYGSYFDGDETIWLAQKGGHINKHIILEVSNLIKAEDIEKVGLYPNPIRRGQHLNFELELAQDVLVKIYDISGKLKIKQSIDQSDNRIQTGKLFPGTYLVETIDNHGNRKSSKVLIQ